MSRFDHFFKSGRQQLMRQHGQTILYVSTSGEQTQLQAIVGEETSECRSSARGQVFQRSRIVEFDFDGLSGLLDIQNRAQVVIDEVAWDVESIVSRESGFIRVRLVRDEPIERTHQGYRINR